VKRHASAEELADLAAGSLKRRKVARIDAHLAICTQCQHVSHELVGVSTLLATASVQFPPMPEQFEVRMEAVLRTEATQRLSGEPATEGGRRDLPGRRNRARSERRGWQLPGLSGRATRLVAAAGALVIIGAGGYTIAANVGPSGPNSTASSGSGAALPHAAPVQPAIGPNVSYHAGGTTHSIRAVRTDTNFVRASLGVQAAAAVSQARHSGFFPMHVQPASAPVPSAGKTFDSGVNGRSTLSGSQLSGCVANVAGAQNVLLVELANYEGHPATIIVLATASQRSAEVWVVSDSCSASDRHALAHLKVPRT
jgi:hypothetical protein